MQRAMQRGLAGALSTLIVSIPVLFAVASATADSIPIEGLVNTGVGRLGNVLTARSLEQNYGMTGPARPAHLVNFDNGSAGYMQLAGLRIEDGFIGGMNTLELVVTNEPNGGLNPSGLQIVNIIGSAMAQGDAPEPPTAVLLFLELTGLTVAGHPR
jgi:hypothetical protein